MRTHQRRRRIKVLAAAYCASRNAARAHEERGEHDAARAAWEYNLTVWAELQGYGVDPDREEAA